MTVHAAVDTPPSVACGWPAYCATIPG